MSNVEEIFGWVATSLTMCFFISPVIPFINVFRGKMNYEDTPVIIITTSYVNCFCWYIYGNMIKSNQVKLCNMIGAISSCILILIYLIYEIRKFVLDAILNALIIITGSYAGYNALTFLIDDQSILGKICNCTSIIVFLYPIQLIYRVVREKNYFLIPIYTAYVSFVASSCWVIYGISFKNLYIVFPNTFGIVLAIMQIIVYFNYKNKFQNFGDKDNSTIGIESSGTEDGKKDEPTTIRIDEDNQSNEKVKPVKIVSKV